MKHIFAQFTDLEIGSLISAVLPSFRKRRLRGKEKKIKIKGKVVAKFSHAQKSKYIPRTVSGELFEG